MKSIYAIIDIALVGIFGMTMIDLMKIISGGGENLLTIDNIIKTLFSLAGLFYLIFVKIIVGIRSARMKRKIEAEQLRKIRMENNVFKENNK